MKEESVVVLAAVCGPRRRAFSRGFTLIELLVVMSIIALLLAIAAPRFMHGTDKAKEAVLMENLARMRVAIDQYHADRGRFPDRIEELVERKYLRSVPQDPITESASTWIAVPPPDKGSNGEIYDVRSGAPGEGRNGRPFGEW